MGNGTPADHRVLEPGRPRVLHVGPDASGQGGMAAVVRTLLGSSLADSYDLSFLSTHSRSRPWARIAAFAVGLPRLMAWCMGPGARIVHVHTATRGSWYRKAICVWMARTLGRPVILHFHGGEGDMRAFYERMGPVRRAAVRSGFLRANRILAVSGASATEIERIFGVRDVLVVPNPSPPVHRDDLAGHPPDGGATLVYMGGFANPAKGGDVLLAALPEILKRNPGAHVVLAGPGEPPPRAVSLLASPGVHWAGYLDQPAKARALSEACLFLMPSISEGMPVALLEAMAYGLPIVATRVGGIPEVVRGGESAVLVEPGDPEAFERAVTGLLADAPQRRRLGAAARSHAQRSNGADVFRTIASVYRSLEASSPAAGRAVSFKRLG